MLLSSLAQWLAEQLLLPSLKGATVRPTIVLRRALEQEVRPAAVFVYDDL